MSATRTSTSGSSERTRNTITSTRKPVEVTVRPILNDDDLKWAQGELGKVLEARTGTRDDARRIVLSELIYAYEDKHHPIPAPDPIDAIEFRLDQSGLTRKALEPILGGRGRVSEILAGKRQLSKEMIRRLNQELDIPLESLMGRTSPAR